LREATSAAELQPEKAKRVAMDRKIAAMIFFML